MSTVMAGVAQEEQLRPAFTVTKLEGKRTRTQHIFDPKSRKVKSREIEEDAGYLVKFAKGHSIRARNAEHLRRIGAGARLVPLLDGDGNVKGSMPNPAADLVEDAA